MGELIEFYRPAKRPQIKPAPMRVVAAPESNPPTAKQVLDMVQLELPNLQAVCVLTKDKDGYYGLVSTEEGCADNLLLMERVKYQMFDMLDSGATEPPPKGTA